VRMNRVLFCITAALLVLIGCTPSQQRTPAVVRAELTRKLPAKLEDRAGWARDIEAAFTHMQIDPTPGNLCAALAVIEQESTFRVDPPVPGLNKIARTEIENRAARFHIPDFLLNAMLARKSDDGRTYAQRLQSVRTEQELSALFEDMISRVPLGTKMLQGLNPIRTGGPMQVRISFAKAHAAGYPYPLGPGGIRAEVFSRRGGLYFGIKHLLDYPNSYGKPLYNFADFNAGRYASRNAAFQRAVALASGQALQLDGDLLLPNAAMDEPGTTEAALRRLRPLAMSDQAIRQALQLSNRYSFEDSALYVDVFERAEAAIKGPLARARIPEIDLNSPKISRPLTTAWFAERVYGRWKKCMAKR
jgi:Protein of unknown function (DUF1615)